LRRTRFETRIATSGTSRRLRETEGTTRCNVEYFQSYCRITTFNRQPSLHKMSTMSHRVGLMSYSGMYFPLSFPDAIIFILESSLYRAHRVSRRWRTHSDVSISNGRDCLLEIASLRRFVTVASACIVH
jgi:hypothetical protein